MLAVDASARLATRMSRLAYTGGEWWAISDEYPKVMPGLRLAGGIGRTASGPAETSKASRASSGCTFLLEDVLGVPFWPVHRWKVSRRSVSQSAERRDGGPVLDVGDAARQWRVSRREVRLRATGPCERRQHIVRKRVRASGSQYLSKFADLTQISSVQWTKVKHVRGAIQVYSQSSRNPAPSVCPCSSLS